MISRDMEDYLDKLVNQHGKSILNELPLSQAVSEKELVQYLKEWEIKKLIMKDVD